MGKSVKHKELLAQLWLRTLVSSTSMTRRNILPAAEFKIALKFPNCLWKGRKTGRFIKMMSSTYHHDFDEGGFSYSFQILATFPKATNLKMIHIVIFPSGISKLSFISLSTFL